MYEDVMGTKTFTSPKSLGVTLSVTNLYVSRTISFPIDHFRKPKSPFYSEGSQNMLQFTVKNCAQITDQNFFQISTTLKYVHINPQMKC